MYESPQTIFYPLVVNIYTVTNGILHSLVERILLSCLYYTRYFNRLIPSDNNILLQ